MEISNRDTPFKGIHSQRGQGTVEYLLILIVMVGILLAGIWQFNTAFKTWANNYFGNYLSCLLETGELPTIGGSPGDSAICAEQFEAFSFAKGKPLKPQKGDDSQNAEKLGSGSGANEATNGRGGGGSSGGSSGRIGRWDSGSGRGGRIVANMAGKKSEDENLGKTGSTAISSTSAGFRNQRPTGTGQRITVLDNDTTLDKVAEGRNKRPKVTGINPPGGTGGKTNIRINLEKKAQKKGFDAGDDSGFNFSNLLRYLLIGGILIALIIFLGGQILSMSKSMEQ